MIKIAFLGDISFNDKYIGLYQQGINPFASISTLLHDQDLVIGNLECIARGSEGENELKKPRLKTNIETLNYLKSLNVSLVTLAHNHIYDNLTDGFRKTAAFLDANNIERIGAGFNSTEAQKPYYYSRDGEKICFLSFLTSDTNPNLPADCPLFLNMYNEERIIKEIKENKKDCTHVVLLLHWGGRFEGGSYPDFYQHRAARKFINAGATIIIGHHSHTLQPFEKLQDKYVFYSLGNFCFSDIQFEGRIKNMSKRNYTETVVPVFQFDKGRHDLVMIPQKNEQLHIIEDSHIMFRLYLRNFFFFFLRFKPVWYIYFLSFKRIRPIIEEFKRKDNEKSLLKRIFALNKTKIKQLLGIHNK